MKQPGAGGALRLGVLPCGSRVRVPAFHGRFV